MTNIITRAIINPTCSLVETDLNFNIVRTVNYAEFISMIDKWKTMLLEKYDAKAGETIFLHGHPSATYYSALFAACELGLINVLDMPRCHNESDLYTERTKKSAPVDYMVRTNYQIDIFGPGAESEDSLRVWSPRPNFKWALERDRLYSRNIIKLEDYEEYTPADTAKYADVVWCTPDSPVIRFPSSGTTGDPKTIFDTHSRCMAMAQRYADYTGMTVGESAIHQNNLNHGSVLVVHWLPSMMSCSTHYTVNPTNSVGMVQFANKMKINRVMLYTTKLLADWLHEIEPVDHDMRIQTLYQITPDIVSLVREKNVACVYGNFGASEIGGAFFTKEITPATDPNTYNTTNLGKPFDDMWELDIRDGKLWVKSDALGQEWTTTNDRFELRNGDYWFMGRDNRYRIGEEWIDLNTFEEQISIYFGEDANIVVDADLQKLYLVLWKPNAFGERQLEDYLKNNFVALRLDYTMRDQPRDLYFGDRKLDYDRVRGFCRNGLGLNFTPCA